MPNILLIHLWHFLLRRIIWIKLVYTNFPASLSILFLQIIRLLWFLFRSYLLLLNWLILGCSILVTSFIFCCLSSCFINDCLLILLCLALAWCFNFLWRLNYSFNWLLRFLIWLFLFLVSWNHFFEEMVGWHISLFLDFCFWIKLALSYWIWLCLHWWTLLILNHVFLQKLRLGVLEIINVILDSCHVSRKFINLLLILQKLCGLCLILCKRLDWTHLCVLILILILLKYLLNLHSLACEGALLFEQLFMLH